MSSAAASASRTDVPEDANTGCPGTESTAAGKTSACDGCPNQSACSSGEARKPDPALGAVGDRMSSVRHKILVLSGKGGVGKSTFSAQLAFTLASRGFSVGLLDVDICGPSMPTMLGLRGRDVHHSGSGWSPVYVTENLAVMSIGFMLPEEDEAVIWRGPKKNGLIRQFLTDVNWGPLDFLIVDTPPGTSDEHITIAQYMRATSQTGAVVVTTPQEVAMADVRKELSFCRKTRIPVYGVVGNMAPLSVPAAALKFTMPDGSDATEAVLAALAAADPALAGVKVVADVFPAAATGPRGMADSFGVPFLGDVPLDTGLLRACESGKAYVETGDGPAVAALSGIVDRVLDGLKEPRRLEEPVDEDAE